MGFVRRADNAAAKARASRGGTTRPVSPSRFTYVTPLWSSQQTTGFPQAMASNCTRPKASAGATEGMQNTSQA